MMVLIVINAVLKSIQTEIATCEVQAVQNQKAFKQQRSQETIGFYLVVTPNYWITARGWDMGRSLKLLLSSIEWRQKTQPDNIRASDLPWSNEGKASIDRVGRWTKTRNFRRKATQMYLNISSDTSTEGPSAGYGGVFGWCSLIEPHSRCPCRLRPSRVI